MKNELVEIKQNFTSDEVQLIKDTIAKNATDAELKLFLYRCQSMGLNPLKSGQVHFVKFGTMPGTIITGIEGFRSNAAKTGKLKGISRGILKDATGKLIGAWAEVYREGWSIPAREETPLHEYNTGKSNWARMPETMIKKCAEAAALRMAFPDEVGGMYTSEEMDQARENSIVPGGPGPEDGAKGFIEEYRIPGGTYAKRGFHEIDPKVLQAYILRIEERLRKFPHKKLEWWDDFVVRAEGYLGDLENSPLEVESTVVDEESFEAFKSPPVSDPRIVK